MIDSFSDWPQVPSAVKGFNRRNNYLDGVRRLEAETRPGGFHPRMNARMSGLITSACVVIMPWGKPG
jgi:hypothetical protein